MAIQFKAPVGGRVASGPQSQPAPLQARSSIISRPAGPSPVRFRPPVRPAAADQTSNPAAIRQTSPPGPPLEAGDQEPPAWLDESAPPHGGGDDEPPFWYGGENEAEEGDRSRRAVAAADPDEFTPERTRRFHQGAPVDIPLGSPFSSHEWAAVRSGSDARATAIEIDCGCGRALVSASWDEPGNAALENLAVDRLRMVLPEASSLPERAALGRLCLVANPEWVGRSIEDFGLPAGTTRAHGVLADAATGEVLGPAPPEEQHRLELLQAARAAEASLLVYTAPKDWLNLRALVYQEREQAWYDSRQDWPRDAAFAVLARPLVLAAGAGVAEAQLDWMVAASADLGVVGPARPGARWTEGEAQAVMRWLQIERQRPENQGLDEAAWIRLEDVAIVRLVDERARSTPSATALIECLAQRLEADSHRELPLGTGERAPAYDRPRG